MRKHGKYEKVKEVSGKPMKKSQQAETKNVLLQSYFTSLLSLILCVSMFFSTSYAWFTSEVTNSGNEIYIGTLDVDLEKYVGGEANDPDDDWASLSEADEKGVNTINLFDGSIRWEPGYTALETIRVVNQGDLAFRYDLMFTNGEITSATEDDDAAELLKKVAENFVVYIHPGDYIQDEDKPVTFRDIEESDKWTPVRFGTEIATLADLLNGDLDLPVLSGSITDVRDLEAKNPTVPTGAGPNDSNEDAMDTYIIALHMKKETDLETMQSIMGQRLSLNVKLVAYQMVGEIDGLGGSYDLQMQINDLGAMDVKAGAPLSKDAKKEHLDTAYQFRPVQTATEAMDTLYRGYHADFVVMTDKDLKDESVMMAGYYAAWCEANGGSWIRMYLPELKAGSEFRMLESLSAQYKFAAGLTVKYEELCAKMDDGIGFLCGLADENYANAGNTVTVELRLYEVVNGKETGQYITLGSRAYKFPAAPETTDEQ